MDICPDRIWSADISSGDEDHTHGRLGDAEKAYERALLRAETALSLVRGMTANLSRTLEDELTQSVAEELERSQKARLALTLDRLASLRLAQLRCREVETLLVRAIELSSESLGCCNPNLIQMLEKLAAHNLAHGCQQKAAELTRQADRAREAARPKQAPAPAPPTQWYSLPTDEPFRL